MNVLSQFTGLAKNWLRLSVCFDCAAYLGALIVNLWLFLGQEGVIRICLSVSWFDSNNVYFRTVCYILAFNIGISLGLFAALMS